MRHPLRRDKGSNLDGQQASSGQSVDEVGLIDETYYLLLVLQAVSRAHLNHLDMLAVKSRVVLLEEMGCFPYFGSSGDLIHREILIIIGRIITR